jgi:osmotically inducible protein OsmC
MIRTGKANWQGTLKEGKGTVSSQSGVLNKTNYSFKSRFEDGAIGTNPEELLATAHAGCFTMQVAALITNKGLTPISLDTVATLTMEGTDIKSIHLSITGSVSGINAEEFTAITKDAEKTCIISKTLKILITSDAKLISENVSLN